MPRTAPLALLLGLVALAAACTNSAREPYRKRCYGADAIYRAGDTFTVDCNTCTCNADGSITCTDEVCTVCEHEGQSYEPGTSFPAGDGCNLCTCMPDASIACTTIGCGTCVYGGMEYQPGNEFPSIDGCNTCTCQAGGGVSCTEIACACDPATEWWRHYESTDPAECTLLDFVCPGSTMRFDNSCGCGCEQDAACAQSYDCTMPGSCDIAQLQLDCPYSEIIQ